MSRAAVATLAALALLAAPVLANDSSAQLGAGGLVLTRSEGIEMRSEDLYVSADEIRVAYRFANITGRDITTLVAFPMPDVTGSPYDPVSLPTEDPENLLDFSTTVDGRPVRARVEQRVFVGEVEHTARLRALGVPLAPHLRAAGEALDRLPPATRRQLVALGLAEAETYDAGRGMETHLAPVWTLRTTYFWEQTFPAGRELDVRHRYRPATGRSAGTIVGMAGDFGGEAARLARQYCMDEAFLAGVRRATARAGYDYPPFTEARVDYILTTGGNWAGPIGDFRLVVDKGSPENLVSFCAEGVRRISPTQFEVRHRNYVPRADLSVIILQRVHPEA